MGYQAGTSKQRNSHICPACNATTNRIKGYYTRKIRHTSCDETPVLLIYRQRRYQCKCGHSFNEKATFASKSFQSWPRPRQVIITAPANKRILDTLPNRNTPDIIRYYTVF